MSDCHAIVWSGEEILLIAPETKESGNAVDFPLVAAAIHNALMKGDDRLQEIVDEYVNEFYEVEVQSMH